MTECCKTCTKWNDCILVCHGASHCHFALKDENRCLPALRAKCEGYKS